jgi:hypothetical protein
VGSGGGFAVVVVGEGDVDRALWKPT